MNETYIMIPDHIRSLMKNYVDQNSQIPTLEWDPKSSIPLNFDPLDKQYEKQKITAHYFLLAAAITETALIGRAENGRAILVDLHSFLENGLFSTKDHNLIEQIIQQYPFFRQLGPEKDSIVETIISVNSFVEKLPDRDLIRYAKSFDHPSKMVTELGKYLPRMSERYSEKAWMYLRWMTRPSDLGIFTNYSPSDLSLPITSYLRDIAECLNLCEYPKKSFWDDPNQINEIRAKLTAFAKEMYPEDPTKVDYPLYLLGRWLRGKRLYQDVLEDHLEFLTNIYEKTGQPPVIYDIVVRGFSSTEVPVKEQLDKLSILYNYESYTFPLPEYTYKPDFILPDYQKNGRTILLEPHGIWTKPIKRKIKIGNRWMTFPAPGRPDPDEIKFTDKLKLFRELFGGSFYLILFVPERYYQTVETRYPDSFDEIHYIGNIPSVLHDIQKYHILKG